MLGVVKSSGEHSSAAEPTELVRGAEREVSHCTASGPLHNWGFQTGSEASAYLPKGALHPAQEVIVAGPDAVSAVDVVDFEPELLHLLKVVVQ